MPNLPLTVEFEFYAAVASVTSEAFADSYLSGAELHQGRLLPRTHKAWERLNESWAARTAIRAANVRLIEPPHFDPAKNMQIRPGA